MAKTRRARPRPGLATIMPPDGAAAADDPKRGSYSKCHDRSQVSQQWPADPERHRLIGKLPAQHSRCTTRRRPPRRAKSLRNSAFAVNDRDYA
jgi:hypothetical protein